MFFDEMPPDTSVYMIAGYAVFFVIAVIYLVSLFVRSRNLSRDLDTLKTVQDETPQAAPVVASAKPRPVRAKSSKAKPARKKVARRK